MSSGTGTVDLGQSGVPAEPERSGEPTGATRRSRAVDLLRRLGEANACLLYTSFCRPDERLDRYEVVLVPSLYLVTEEDGAKLVSYVERGGTAVVSFWSGIVDERDVVYLGPYGGPLRPLIGCDVVDVAPLPEGMTIEVEWEDGTRTGASFWADVATEGTGHVLARVASGPWAGRPAVVEARVGQGRAYYLACRLDAAGLARVYDLAPALSGEPAVHRAGPGVERVVRTLSLIHI